MLLSAQLDRRLPSLRRMLWAIAAVACLIAALLHANDHVSSPPTVAVQGVATEVGDFSSAAKGFGHDRW
ncbi:hypothetical protein V5738_12115 [Salinisphaera sp. SPP-AMP-43]|uniref:hypothetical protein n=1 Tax=Salinisphaera sp. SPP-AMP-43 TaxID=3121288 RepID=UPI003C6E552C